MFGRVISKSVLAAALAVSTSAPAISSCRDPIPVGIQHGHFTKIDLPDSCSGNDVLPHPIALDLGDREPILELDQIANGTCASTLVTFRNDLPATILTAPENLAYGPPAEASDHSYWAIDRDGTHYVRVADDGTVTAPASTGPQWTIASIAADGTGRLFSLERRATGAPGRDVWHVADVSTGHVTALGPGSPEGLLRATDGSIYFRQFDAGGTTWHCFFFRIDAAGRPVRSTACEWRNGDGIAVGRAGAIWQGAPLGVSSTDATIGPILPMPCTITNTAVLTPHALAANQAGDVWFLYGKLYHVGKDGAVLAIAVPADAGSGGIRLAADGSLWLLGRTAIYRFDAAE